MGKGRIVTATNTWPLLLVVLLAANLDCGMGGADQTGFKTIRFKKTVENVHAIQAPFHDDSLHHLGSLCPEIHGTVKYGAIPHRLIRDGALSTEHFIDFIVAYGDTKPMFFIDLDEDRNLACDERLEPVIDPKDPAVAFRSLVVSWNEVGMGPREQRYRLLVPATLAGDRPHYSIDVVDVPVARFEILGQATTWVLYDGNFNGIHDLQFGDALLADMTGDKTLSLDPEGPNLHSYHAPIRTPEGTFEVKEIDPEGGFISLAAVPDVGPDKVLEEGDQVAATECKSLDGAREVLGGASGHYQLLYFWLSGCASCGRDLELLNPVLTELGTDRIQSLGISLDEELDRARSFAHSAGGSWLHCYSGRMLWENPLARQFGAKHPGSFVLIDPTGRIVAKGIQLAQIQAALQAAHVAVDASTAGL